MYGTGFLFRQPPAATPYEPLLLPWGQHVPSLSPLHTPLAASSPFPHPLIGFSPTSQGFCTLESSQTFLTLPSGLTCSVNGLGFVVEEMNCVSQLRFLGTVHAVNRVGSRICLSIG